MAKKGDWRTELENVAEVLRNPFKMRLAVAGITLVVMCFAINDPLQGKIKSHRRDLNRMKTTVRTAEEVMLLRDHLADVDDRIVRGKSNDVIVAHLIELVRGETVDLMGIDAQAPERLGPMESIRVTMDVNGTFESLVRLLHRFDSDQYLIRVETVSIQPPKRDRSIPTMNVSLRMIKEAE